MLTPKGFLELAQEGVLHPVILDDKAITDRSKADWLAKFLVCAQAFWMVFNVIARKASGLPSILIELNVIVHVVVMVIVYGLWWNKPLVVQNPIILNPSPKYIDENTTIPSIQTYAEDLYYQILLLHKDDLPLKSVYWNDDYLTGSLEYGRRSVFEHNHPRLFWFHRLFKYDWRSDYQNHPISSSTAEENNNKYLGQLGYDNISIPEGLSWKYSVVSEMDANSDKIEKNNWRGIVITELNLIMKNHPKGLLLLWGQILVSKARESCVYGAASRYRRPVFLTEHQLRLIEQLEVIQIKKYLPESDKDGCGWAKPDTSNITFKAGISGWAKAIKGSKGQSGAQPQSSLLGEQFSALFMLGVMQPHGILTFHRLRKDIFGGVLALSS
ncbi:hypothetical protein FPQ18DRAFT_32583 [Pyronema domesticum]|nr:hypothetical protein FPQ18DRAFT_32583 [Pyronema domesticum]